MIEWRSSLPKHIAGLFGCTAVIFAILFSAETTNRQLAYLALAAIIWFILLYMAISEYAVFESDLARWDAKNAQHNEFFTQSALASVSLVLLVWGVTGGIVTLSVVAASAFGFFAFSTLRENIGRRIDVANRAELLEDSLPPMVVEVEDTPPLPAPTASPSVRTGSVPVQNQYGTSSEPKNTPPSAEVGGITRPDNVTDAEFDTIEAAWREGCERHAPTRCSFNCIIGKLPTGVGRKRRLEQVRATVKYLEQKAYLQGRQQ